MCKHPTMRAPLRGRVLPCLARRFMRPGLWHQDISMSILCPVESGLAHISFSDKPMSLRPQAARLSEQTSNQHGEPERDRGTHEICHHNIA